MMVYVLEENLICSIVFIIRLVGEHGVVSLNRLFNRALTAQHTRRLPLAHTRTALGLLLEMYSTFCRFPLSFL